MTAPKVMTPMAVSMPDYMKGTHRRSMVPSRFPQLNAVPEGDQAFQPLGKERRAKSEE
jgi:hypothetical protein